MSRYYVINKSGIIVPVYSTESGAFYKNGTVIGHIYPDECCTMCGTNEGENVQHTTFRNSSGQVNTNGYVNSMNGGCYSIGFNMVSDYAGKETIYINGVARDVDAYYMRRGETVYRNDGTVWGSVAGGQKVYANRDEDYTGDTHTEWFKIVAVTSTSGALVPVMSYGSNYGYVNIGFEDGSMKNQISVYAPNW